MPLKDHSKKTHVSVLTTEDGKVDPENIKAHLENFLDENE
jgi:hypothetical protein